MIPLPEGPPAAVARAPRPRPKVMTISDAAAARVREAVAGSDRPVVGLRVGVRNGGCAGMAYTVELAEAVGPHDEVIDEAGARVLVDPKAVLFLLGSRMDVRADRFSSTFVFDNPNQTSACGCGESVAITPAAPASAP